MARGRRERPRSLLGRADHQQSGSGADALFARLDAMDTRQESMADQPDARQQDAAELLARWAERLRAGAWSDELADLVARAEALERALAEE